MGALVFPLTLANVHYIYRKHSGNAEALTAIQTLAKIGNIATMDSGHVMRALANCQTDFEDELQIAAPPLCPNSLPSSPATSRTTTMARCLQ